MDTFLRVEQIEQLLFLIDDVDGLESLAAHLRDLLAGNLKDVNPVTVLEEELGLLADTLEDLHDWIPLVAQIDDELAQFAEY